MTTRRRLGLLALSCLAPAVFFHRVCLGGEAFYLRDLFDWFYPWRTFAADSLARGDFPLWNPYSYMGTPFLANMQSGLLYPLNAAFWLLDFPSAMRVFLILQFAVAAGAVYVLLRTMSCRVSSSLTGAVAYAYGGWMVVHVEFPNKLAAAAWLPLIVLGVVIWRQGRPLHGLVVGAIGTALCVTAGYPSLAFVLMLGTAFLWAAMLLTGLLARRPAATLLRETLSLPSIAVLGALLAAAQIVPFLEAASLSDYPAQFRPLGLHPVHFLDLILPHSFGLPGYERYWGGELHQFWLGHFYVGLATLGLALAAAAGLSMKESGRHEAIMTGLIALAPAVALSMGDHAPLASFCSWLLPGFARIKFISASSVLVAFCLAWLAAFGQELLLDSLERRSAPPRRFGALIHSCATVMILLGLLALVAPTALETMVRAAVSPVVMSEQTKAIAANIGIVRADAVRAAVIAAVLAASWWAAARGRLRASVLGAMIPLAIFVDLKGAASGINFSASPEVYRETPPRAKEVAERFGSTARIYVTVSSLAQDLRIYGSTKVDDFRWAADTFLYNLNLPHRLFSASGGDPLYSSRWKRFAEGMDGADDDLRGRMMALASVAILYTGTPGSPPEEIEVPVWLPRVHVSAGARRVPSGEVFSAMMRDRWNPFLETIVEDDFPGEPRPDQGRMLPQKVSRVEHTNNTVTIEVESEAPGYLILSDANYPGWRASVDSRPVVIFTANSLFRGIDLPAGRHTVVFEYRPASVAWGACGSALGLIVLGAVAWSASRRSGSNRPIGPSRETDPAPPRRSPSP